MMKQRFVISTAVVLICLTFFSQCKKEETIDPNNWAARVAGTYTGTAKASDVDYAATTVISRVNDTLIDIKTRFVIDSVCVNNVRMHSGADFYIAQPDNCKERFMEGVGSSVRDSLNVTYWIDDKPIKVTGVR